MWNELAPGPEVLAAYQHCERVVRGSGSSFAATFWMLSRPRRRALHAIYAFCRLADDIADDPGVRGDRQRLLKRWREELQAAYRGKATHPVGVGLGDAVRRFQLPEETFLELLRGIESDLNGEAMETFDDLCQYCYRVASTVGLLIVQVLGCLHPRTRQYAAALGIAVQLTNVLRDVGPDARAGRIYLPREDLERFGLAPASLIGAWERDENQGQEALRLLMALYAERARIFYERAERLLPEPDRRTLRPAEAMGRIYRALLEELQRRGFPCLQEPVRLSSRRRLAIAISIWLGAGSRRANRQTRPPPHTREEATP